MAAATGGIADFEVENGRLRVGLPLGLVQYGVKGRVEQAVDQAGRRVVAAGGLALVAAGGGQREFRGLDMQNGMQFQQRFVDAAQFFGAKVLVVHDAAVVPVVGEGQRAYGSEQVAVGDLAVDDVRYGIAREEKAVQGGQAKFGTAIVAAKRLHY